MPTVKEYSEKEIVQLLMLNVYKYKYLSFNMKVNTYFNHKALTICHIHSYLVIGYYLIILCKHAQFVYSIVKALLVGIIVR